LFFHIHRLVDGVSWSNLTCLEKQVFGMQCASCTHHKIASHPGIMAHSWASRYPFHSYQLLALGYCPLIVGFCLVRRTVASCPKNMARFTGFSPEILSCSPPRGYIYVYVHD
jgi:hypothetical protein